MNNDLISREKLKKAMQTEIANVPQPDTDADYYVGVKQGLKLAETIIDNAPVVELLPENVIETHTKIGYDRGFNDGYAKCVEDNERPQGEWIAIASPIADNEIHIVCTHCGEEFIGKNDLDTWKEEYLFCNRCGADMRKGDAEDENNGKNQ